MKQHFSRPFSILPRTIAILAILAQLARAQTGPTITQQPQSQTNLAGANVTLSVAVSGTGPCTYQWQFNGANLPNIITTVAGTSYLYPFQSPLYSHPAGDGGPATSASLSEPFGVAVDAFGNLFIADTNNRRIRKVDPNGIISTVAGDVTIGYFGDGGPATDASLSQPSGVTADASGNLFIADTQNFVIRKVDVNGIITTVAGNGAYGYSGDGGPATSASLSYPSGVAVDASGNLFIADRNNDVIREVLQREGILSFDISPASAGSYEVIVTSPYGSVTSSVAKVTVLFPPSIINQPTNVATAIGTTASFSVVATGPQPLSYAWYFDRTNLVDGATNSNLALANVSLNQAGGYTVVITNLNGSVTSAIATLSFEYPPIITVQPASQTNVAGATTILSVAVSPNFSGPYNYQWQLNGTTVPDDLITTVAGGGATSQATAARRRTRD